MNIYLKQSSIGNSSSGIWEAQTAKVPAINVGSRQNGRTRSTNVIDVQLDENKILNAISRLKAMIFRRKLRIVQIHTTRKTLPN